MNSIYCVILLMFAVNVICINEQMEDSFMSSNDIFNEYEDDSDGDSDVMFNSTDDQLLLASSASMMTDNNQINSRLLGMLYRGRQLIKLLPTMSLVLLRKVIDHIPSPSEVLNFSKQTLIGMPQEIIAYAIHQVCSTAATLRVIESDLVPHIHELNYILITKNNTEIVIPLNQSEFLYNNEHFKVMWKVVIIVTGWNSNINLTNEALETLYAAYQCRDNYNFIIIDTARFVDTLYSWSAFSTQPIGEIIGRALVNLTQFVDLSDLHLIGHSLGAHICGVAGRTYQQLTNKTITRITGLDPARPCFNEGERLNGLQRGDAEFVDIIHTNAGILGMKEPIGDVDFYPNGRDPLQPGCWTIFCAHSRAYQYFAETVYPGNEQNFMSTKCSSLASYRLGRCRGRNDGGGQIVPMGIATPSMARGSFYLETNAKSPFGKHKRGPWYWLFGNYKTRSPKCIPP